MARVLHIVSSQGLYGAEKVVLALCQQGAGDANAIAVFHNRHSPNLDVARAAEKLGIRVYEIECAGRFDRKVPTRLRAAITDFNANVAHSHGYKSNLFSLAAARTSTVRTVSTCHGWGTPAGLVKAFTFIDLSCLRFFDRVVVVSQSMVPRLTSFGVAASKSAVIPNGIDLRPFAAIPLKTARAAHEMKTVGMVGRLVLEKGGDTFLNAAQAIRRQREDVRFVFFGDGPLLSSLKQRVDELGISGSVNFAGRVEDMQQVYSSLDVLTMPSISEGLPLTLLEAMAAGVPVIATRVGEIPSVLQNGNGILIDVGDSSALAEGILKLLDNNDFRESVSVSARAHVIRYHSSSTMAAAYRELYRELVQ